MSLFSTIQPNHYASLDEVFTRGSAKLATMKPLGLVDYQDEILDRLEKSTVWHLDRGEARGIQRGDGWAGLVALDGLLDAVADIAVSPDVAGDEAADMALEAAHAALSDAKHAADRDTIHDDDTVSQSREVEETDARELLRIWGDLELLRRASRDGHISDDRALAQASALLFAAPNYQLRECA